MQAIIPLLIALIVLFLILPVLLKILLPVLLILGLVTVISRAISGGDRRKQKRFDTSMPQGPAEDSRPTSVHDDSFWQKSHQVEEIPYEVIEEDEPQGPK